jgi:hypothetical protein
MDAGASRGVGGVMGDARGETKVEGVVLGVAEVSEAGDKGAM